MSSHEPGADPAAGATDRSPSPVSAVQAFLAGIVATLAGMAAGHLVAGLTAPQTSPVLAVGSTVVDLTPTPLKEWAIRQFGTNDKAVLIGSVLVVTLLLAGVAGLLARRRFPLGLGLLLALVVVAGVLALLRPTAGLVAVVPALATGLVGALALTALVLPRGLRALPGVPRGEREPEPSRRGFLLGAGTVVVAAAAMGAAGEWISRARTRVGDIMLPKARDPLAPLPTGLEQRFEGISAFQTPQSVFYRVDTRLSLPTVNPDGWSLTIDGDVENELTFSFDELLAEPLEEHDITMTCVSNQVGGDLVGSGRWLGVRVDRLLERAGVGDTANQILSTDVDGFTISTPLEVATDGRPTLVAVGLNGEPLLRKHGFPARLITPGLYGFVGATKWLTRMTLTTYQEQMAYWTERDWATEAPIKISSRVDTPTPLSTVPPGKTILGGVAWAQQRGVAKVEVRIDGGQWQQANLGPSAGINYWRQWYFPWQATSGQHMIAVRCTDKDGTVQTAARAKPFPEGSSGIQEVVIIVS